MSITLYHAPRSRSVRPLWTLLELGLDHQLELVPFPSGKDPDHLARNPLGTVPWLTDGDVGINESVAITQYLATRYGPSELALQPDEADYGQFLNWLTFGEASLTYPLSLVIHYGPHYQKIVPGSPQFPEVVDYYLDSFRTALGLVDTALTNREFLAGDRFTIADISVGYNFRLLDVIGLADEASPRLKDYWKRLSARPAYLRIAEAELNVSRADLPADSRGAKIG